MTIYTPKRTSAGGTHISKRHKGTYATPTQKRVKYGIPRTVKSFGRQALPDTLTNTVRYCDVATITLTSGFGTRRFRANGLYDPDVGVGGHQPRYFDELMALYNHFHVLRSRIKIQTASAPVGNAGYIACVLDDDSTFTFSNSYGPLEQADNVNASWTAAGETKTLYMTYDSVQKFGRGTLSNSELSGNAASDPLEQMVFHVCAHDPQLNSGNCYVKIEIEYDVVWSELKTSTAS